MLAWLLHFFLGEFPPSVEVPIASHEDIPTFFGGNPLVMEAYEEYLNLLTAFANGNATETEVKIGRQELCDLLPSHANPAEWLSADIMRESIPAN